MITQLVKIVIKNNYLLYVASFIVLFISAILFSENNFKKESQEEGEELAQHFATPLWRFDTESIRYYLLLAIGHDQYLEVSILDEVGSVIDEEIKSENKLNSFFYNNIRINQKIVFKEQYLGSISILKKNANNFLYVAIVLFFILLLIFKSIYQNLKKKKLDTELLFKQSFDYNASIMGIIDFETGFFVDINKAFLNVFKFTKRKDVVGKTASELNIFRELFDAKKIMNELDLNHHVYQREMGCFTSRNDEIILLVSLRLVELEQKTLLLFTSIDITNKKKSEQKLEETNKKLIESARVAGQAEIATGVLHNVGNVLNSARISASVVKENIYKDNDDSLVKISNYLKKSDQKDNKLIAYINGIDKVHQNILSNSRKEVENLIHHLGHITEIVKLHQSYSKSSHVLEAILPEQIIEDAVRVNQGALERHNVQLIIHRGVSVSLLLDHHRMLQILINLISNAKYATIANGKSERIVEINFDVTDGRLEIIVRDNGIGISKENIDQIFNYGFTTREGGHGFGLHSCANVVGELNGSISVRSDGAGKGSTFTLVVPTEKVCDACA